MKLLGMGVVGIPLGLVDAFWSPLFDRHFTVQAPWLDPVLNSSDSSSERWVGRRCHSSNTESSAPVGGHGRLHRGVSGSSSRHGVRRHGCYLTVMLCYCLCHYRWHRCWRRVTWRRHLLSLLLLVSQSSECSGLHLGVGEQVSEHLLLLRRQVELHFTHFVVVLQWLVSNVWFKSIGDSVPRIVWNRDGFC